VRLAMTWEKVSRFFAVRLAMTWEKVSCFFTVRLAMTLSLLVHGLRLGARRVFG
jgi:hypothetical protein